MTARPKYAVQRDREAGWALRASSTSQKVLTAVLACDKSWTSRQCNGHPNGAVQRFFETVRKLVADGRTDAGHVIAGALAVAEEEACKLPTDVIRARLYHALTEETRAQAEEDRAEYRVVRALHDDPTDLRAALEAHDEAIRQESGWHITALIYNRALRVARGWRAAP